MCVWTLSTAVSLGIPQSSVGELPPAAYMGRLSAGDRK